VETTDIPAHGFACPCGEAVLDLRGSARGEELCCPRCARVFRLGEPGDSPALVSGPPARRSRALRTAVGLTDGRPPKPVSSSRLMAKYVMIWTAFVTFLFGLYMLFSLLGGKTIKWDRVPWQIWAVAIPGAAVLGFALWAAHTYFLVHRPKVRRAREKRERAEREAGRGGRDGGGTKSRPEEIPAEVPGEGPAEGPGEGPSGEGPGLS